MCECVQECGHRQKKKYEYPDSSEIEFHFVFISRIPCLFLFLFWIWYQIHKQKCMLSTFYLHKINSHKRNDIYNVHLYYSTTQYIQHFCTYSKLPPKRTTQIYIHIYNHTLLVRLKNTEETESRLLYWLKLCTTQQNRFLFTIPQCSLCVVFVNNINIHIRMRMRPLPHRTKNNTNSHTTHTHMRSRSFSPFVVAL